MFNKSISRSLACIIGCISILLMSQTYPSPGPGGVVSGAGGGGLVLLEEHTASASASLGFTTCMAAGYDEMQVEVVNLLPATNDIDIHLQYSTNGGSTYDSTSGHYSSVNTNWAIPTGGLQGFGNNSTTFVGIGNESGNVSNVAANGGLTSSFKIYNGASGVAGPRIHGISDQYHVAGTLNDQMTVYGGTYLQTTAVNAFQIIASSGNLTSGTVRCYGLNH